MIRRMLVAILSLALRVFFRRIEVRGLERVPQGGAIIFVLNHPNALVDPVFLLCRAPRRVSFLAKAPIFKMPVLGWIARALDAIPVYRRQDAGADLSRNRETFTRARALLKGGGTLAICPEGVSHSDPKLRPLKTGAARIALGVVAEDAQLDLKIVPAGLYYTAKTAFRSAALLRFGAPLQVNAVAPDERGEPPASAVHELSARIERALHEVTLNAEHEQALDLAKRAERIFSAAGDATTEDTDNAQSLAREVELRRRFLAGYAFHFEHSPARLAALEARIRRYELELARAGVDAEDLSAPKATPRRIAVYILTRVVPVLSWFPVALFGFALHYPAYKLAGFISTALARRSDDVVSTIKLVAAMLFFPLTWAMFAALLFTALGWPGVPLGLFIAPASAYVALLFNEQLDGFISSARALRFYLTRRRFFKELLVERRRLRAEMIALAAEADADASAVAAAALFEARPSPADELLAVVSDGE